MEPAKRFNFGGLCVGFLAFWLLVSLVQVVDGYAQDYDVLGSLSDDGDDDKGNETDVSFLYVENGFKFFFNSSPRAYANR